MDLKRQFKKMDYRNIQFHKCTIMCKKQYFHHTFISDLSSGLGASISIVIRYPEEEGENCYSGKYSLIDTTAAPVLLLLFISCLSSVLKASAKIRSSSFTFSKVLLRSESNEDPGQAHQERHHQVNSYPRVQNLVLGAWRPKEEQENLSKARQLDLHQDLIAAEELTTVKRWRWGKGWSDHWSSAGSDWESALRNTLGKEKKKHLRLERHHRWHGFTPRANMRIFTNDLTQCWAWI